MNYSDRTQQERIFAAFAGPMVTGILGPRRVGKSTLIDHYFSLNPDETVVNLNMDSMHEREKIKAGLLEDLILNAIRRHLTPGQRVYSLLADQRRR